MDLTYERSAKKECLDDRDAYADCGYSLFAIDFHS
jgi:hypothetical protein